MNECGDSSIVELPLFQEEDGGAIPTSPLQLEVIEIGVKYAQGLNELWHSILPKTVFGNIVRNSHYVCYGAHYENIYYAVAIWTSPVAQNRFKDGKAILELRRFAISPDAPHNTASRLLKVMRSLIRCKFPDIKRLISYQAVEHHQGTIYKAAGWRCMNESQYEIWHKGEMRNDPQTVSAKLRWEVHQ